MNAKQNRNSIEQQLGSIAMQQQVRDAVLNDARIAGMFVDAIVWICGKVRQAGAGEFVRPNVNYWE